MIITCPSCKKKFEIDASLIPNIGRTLQCGSCEKKWFYDPNLKVTPDLTPQIKENEKFEESKQKLEIIDSKIESEKKQILSDENLQKIQINNKRSKLSNSSDFSLGKILSFFLVFIITFIALIIILDTFKAPLSNFFPNLELLLYNLFESIKDVNLFVKDLLI